MKPTPPRWPLRLLRWFCREDYLEEIEGDLVEIFEKQYDHSPFKAHWKFTLAVIRYFRPGFIRSFKNNALNTLAMLRHNFLLTYRGFLRNKTTLLVHLGSLAPGLACALLIYLWVSDELAVDKFHKNRDRLYQVIERISTPHDAGVSVSTAGLLGEALKEEVPGVTHTVTTRLRDEAKTLSAGDRHVKSNVLYASEEFFRVFSFELVYGNEDLVLTDKNSMVISEELAIKLFNTTENVIGKIVEFQREKEFQVSGIFKGTPSHSSLQFDFVLSFDEYKEIDPNVLNWNYNTSSTYLLVQKGMKKERLDVKLADFYENKRSTPHGTLSTRLFSETYLYGRYENGEQAGGRIEYVQLFSLIAIFILLIACINFMNLSTAKATRRMKEIGVKKVVGAGRQALIYQHLGESLLITLASLLVALIVVKLCLPQFNEVTGKDLVLDFDVKLVFFILGICLLTGIVAGSYPAMYLSRLHPVLVLKGTPPNSPWELWTRKGMVIFQFTLSVILIVAVVVVYQQIEFVQGKNLGYNRDNILYFDIEGKVREHLETFLAEVNELPGIVSAAGIGQNIVEAGTNMFTIDHWEGKNDETMVPAFEMRPVTYGMIETLGIEMAAGRTFSKNFSTEDSKVIFNAAAIDAMGLEDPIGKIINIRGTRLEIIGVTKNFHFASLHEEVQPLFFVLRLSWTHKVMARIEAGREQEAIEGLQVFYRQYNPGFPLDYQFLNQDYRALYAAEQRVAVLSRYFAGLAILISCLGLFGLAAFTAERRTKEMGIRKVLGLSEFGIIRLLSQDFTGMVLMALLFALPISYLAARHWLDGFAYSIDLAWWYFFGAGLVALLIAWFTVSLQTLKVARISPAQCLNDNE